MADLSRHLSGWNASEKRRKTKEKKMKSNNSCVLLVGMREYLHKGDWVCLVVDNALEENPGLECSRQMVGIVTILRVLLG